MMVPLPALTGGRGAQEREAGDQQRRGGRRDSDGGARGRGDPHGKIRSIFRQSFWAAAHLDVQSGAWLS